jgi:hypothetical protein
MMIAWIKYTEKEWRVEVTREFKPGTVKVIAVWNDPAPLAVDRAALTNMVEDLVNLTATLSGAS